MIMRVVRSLFATLVKKIRYGSRYDSSLIQGFERVSVELDHVSRIKIGTRNQSRGNIFLIAREKGFLELGNHIYLNNNTYIASYGHISIGDHTSIGNNVVIVDHDHDFRSKDGGFVAGSVEIGKNVWIGANCTILKNVKIGDNAVIAAGSVVKRDVPANSILVQKREDIVTPYELG